MFYKRFQVSWRNIYLVKPDEGDNHGDETDNDDKGEDMDDDNGSKTPDERWFAKVAPIIDLVNETSKCKFPVFCVSIDEQMKKFKGRSGKTFRMKNKPISEGYKFWAICCANSGFATTTYPLHKQAMLKEERSSTQSYYYFGNFPRKN